MLIKLTQLQKNTATINITGLSASTSYTYDLYLQVDDTSFKSESTTVKFTTDRISSWSINFAEIALALPERTNVGPYK